MKKLSLLVIALFLIGIVVYGYETGTWANGDETWTNASVGIGTDQPEQMLHIKSSYAKMVLESPNSKWWFYARPDGSLRFSDLGGSSSALRMYIGPNGNIGIGGTTNPASKLHVNGTVLMDGFKLPSDAPSGYVLTTDGSGVGTWESIGGGGGGSSLWSIGVGNDIYYDEGNGNVGIGINDPQSLLHLGSSEGGNNKIRLGSGAGGPHGIDFVDLDNTVGLSLYYRTSPQELYIEGSNGKLVTFQKDGKVGIGTTGPGSKLDVNGTVQMEGFKMSTGAVNGYVLTSDSNGVGTWQPGGGGSGTSLWSENDGDIYNINSTGRVGIGTSTPSCELDINGDINIANSNVLQFGEQDFIKRWESNYSFAVGKNAGADETKCVYIGDYAGNANTGSHVTTLGYEAGCSNSSSYLTALGYHAAFSSSGNNYVTAVGFYAGSGNSGSSVTALGSRAGQNNEGVGVSVLGSYAGYGNSGDWSCGFGHYALHANTGNNVVAIGRGAAQDNTASNVFIVKQSNVNTTPLIYGDFSNGYVGIGTTDLQAALTVNGTIKAEEIKVAVDIQPDYVFEDDYNLMSLNKLEKHIKENKHLPGIPSSEEAVKNGLEVGDMQTKLLEKVEELTLYVIEQDKELTELKKEVGNLRKENRELHQKISSSSN